MSDGKNNDFERNDIWLWENQCFEELEDQNDYETKLQQEKELTYQKLWHLFQGAATCVAHLHKGSQGAPDRSIRWTPFQTAAGSVTALYKESVDGVRRCTELAVLHGRQLRNRELATWLRRRRSSSTTGSVSREELLAFLTGRALPLAASHTANTPVASAARVNSRSVSASLLRPYSPSPASVVANCLRSPCRRLHPPTTCYSTSASSDSVASQFASSDVDAFLLNSLQGVTVHQQQSSPPRHSHSRRHSAVTAPAPIQHHTSSNVKRPATPSSPSDVTMDSPTHKRPRIS